MRQSIKYSVLLFLDQKLVIAESVILDMEKADSPYRVDESSLVDVPELDFSDILTLIAFALAISVGLMLLLIIEQTISNL